MATKRERLSQMKLHLKAFPSSGSKDSIESRYWKSFKFPTMITHTGAITQVEIVKPESSLEFLSAHGTNVDIWDGKSASKNPSRTIARFKEPVLAATFRSDAKLLAAGGKDRKILVLNVTTRVQMRSLQGHSDSISSLRFSTAQKSQLMSGSHDKTVRQWDIPTEKCVRQLTGHQDQIRTLVELSSGGPHLWLSASYDATVRLWDLRSSDPCQMILPHAAAVETVLCFPSGSALVTGGADGITMWDLLGGRGDTSSFSSSSSSSSNLSLFSSDEREAVAADETIKKGGDEKDKEGGGEEEDDDDDKEGGEGEDDDEEKDEDEDAKDEEEDEEEEERRDDSDESQKENTSQSVERQQNISRRGAITARKFGSTVQPLLRIDNHQKPITCLAFDGTRSRLLSGSLDQQVKVHDLQTYRVTHSFKYSAPIYTMDIARDNSLLVVGMADGVLSIRKRKMLVMSSSADESLKPPPGSVFGISAGSSSSITRGVRPGGPSRFLKGKSKSRSPLDFVVDRDSSFRMKAYERLLRSFMYREALDVVLKTNDPVLVVSMIEELMMRKGLETAINGRDDEKLQPLLQFVLNFITHPRYSNRLAHVCNRILDIYAPVVGQSIVIDELLFKLQKKLNNEIKTQKQILFLMGSLQLVFANSKSISDDLITSEVL